MKILKLPTYWTAEEADTIYNLLDDLKTIVWDHYGDEIQQMYQEIREEQLQLELEWEQEHGLPPYDEIPF